MLVALVEQVLRHFLAVGDEDRDELGREQAVDRADELVLGEPRRYVPSAAPRIWMRNG
jgi:hypothetical protein